VNWIHITRIEECDEGLYFTCYTKHELMVIQSLFRSAPEIHMMYTAFSNSSVQGRSESGHLTDSLRKL
jgi:hypothetical protein